MQIDVICFLNSLFESNTYILTKFDQQDVWIVDPGDTQPIFEWMSQHKKQSIKGVLFTHGHFDHIYGINEIFKQCPQCVFYVANDYGQSLLYDSCKNNSKFTSYGPIVLNESAKVIQCPQNLELWPDVELQLMYTPGHSDDSVCFLVGSALITGDTLIKNTRTVTKLKTGNNEKLYHTIALIRQLQGKNYIVYPGHGESFDLDGYDLEKMVRKIQI